MQTALDANTTGPKVPNIHLFSAGGATYLLDVECGGISEVGKPMAQAMRGAMDFGDSGRVSLMVSAIGIQPIALAEPEPPSAIPVRSFSLAIAQKCNLGCTYCYAEQGTFGGRPSNMDLEVAKASVETLLTGATPGEKITLAFMGGEPLFNRSTLHAVTKYAAERAIESNVGVAFSITTNATLIVPEDVELFQQYKFTVTVSIDGLKEANDALRPTKSGEGSFEMVEEKLKLLMEFPDRQFMVLARVSVTPKNLDLAATMKGLLSKGFDSVKFSPILKSPTGQEEMQKADFDTLLEQMIACGDEFKDGLSREKLYPVANIISTIKRIHHYQREQYPCGAGGGYMGVSAEGGLYACHRFVNDDDGHLGDVESGVDPEKQSQWLEERHLSAQDPCTSCWARYLCSGSCHHEVIKRGRPACDYIRGWLHYCLGLYVELLQSHPDVLRGVLGDPQRELAEYWSSNEGQAFRR